MTPFFPAEPIRFPAMTVQPTHLQIVDDRQLEIHWSDGTRRRYSPAELRHHCPCATCNSERRRAEAAGESFATPTDVELRHMRPTGNYGYNIAFSDDHATGIFPLELLRELGREV